MKKVWPWVLVLEHKFYQEYTIDKSMKPRIHTVNDILRKWRSETSHVGKVTIWLFQRNAWILLHVHVLAPWVLLLALSDRGYILWHVSKTLTMTRWVLEFRRGLPSMWSGRLQWRSVECYLQDLLDRISAASYVRTFDDRVVFWRHCENGWLSGPLYVCDWGATFRAMHYVVILI